MEKYSYHCTNKNIQYLFYIIPNKLLLLAKLFIKQLINHIFLNTYEKRRIFFVFLCFQRQNPH